MRNTLNRTTTTLYTTFTSLYALAMILFLGMAFILVLTQIAGLFLGQGGWIAGASENLLRPTIVAAVAAGILGFCVYNLEGTPETERDKD